MTLDTVRFVRDLEDLTAIGATADGGCERLAYSDADMQARALLVERMQEAGLTVETDAVGCIWGRLEGEQPDLSAVLVGSHIDTVRNGGRYDGLLGVLFGLAALRQIKAEKTPHRRSLELLVLPCEESARFNYPTAGSKLLAGKVAPDELRHMNDADGLSLYDAMCQRGLEPDRAGEARGRLARAKCFLELHIEQGPVLCTQGPAVGLVTAIAAPIRLSVDIRGEAAHSGACPMELRRDALAAAAAFTLAVEAVGKAEAPCRTVAAVTCCEVAGQSMNVVPGRVKLVVDLRGIDEESMERALAQIHQAAADIGAVRQVAFFVELMSRDRPVAMSPALLTRLEAVCRRLGQQYRLMPSGAGHDAMNLASVVETGLLFIPCAGGISHNPAEAVEQTDVARGFAVLAQALLAEAE